MIIESCSVDFIPKYIGFTHNIRFPFRSNEGLEAGIRLLEDATKINEQAKQAIALGDGTLKEANETYETLTGKEATNFPLFEIFHTDLL